MKKQKKETRHFDIVRDKNTGRFFLAEYSSEAAEWYEFGTGRAHSMLSVELIGPVAGKLVEDAEQKANEWAHRGLDHEDCNITRGEVENTLCDFFSRGFDSARNMLTAEISEMLRHLSVGCARDAIIYGRGSIRKEDVARGLEQIGNGKKAQGVQGVQDVTAAPASLEGEINAFIHSWEYDDDAGLFVDTAAGKIPIDLDNVRELARHIAAWHSKRVAAYIRECLEPEEGLTEVLGEDYEDVNYTRGKVRGYKDILRDLESGGLDEYMDGKDNSKTL